MKNYIGKKKIKESKLTEEKTPAGTEIIEVTFEDLSVEHFSKLMFEKIVSEKQCNEAELRDKRVIPVVKVLLTVLREWGIKTGELPYLSSFLNRSLNYNNDQALLSLIGKYMPKPNSLDEVDLITIDRILKEQKLTIKDVI